MNQSSDAARLPADVAAGIGTGALASAGGLDRRETAGSLRRKTAHGALVSAGAQGLTFVLRLGSTAALSRLLLTTDFGLVGMVTAFTGFLGLFRDAGLSMATIQRASITEAQISTLFWLNVGLGAILTALASVAAPGLAAFYGEPRLLAVTVALGTGFLFNGAAAQHRAILQRDLRFTALAIIDIVSLILSTVLGVALGLAHYGYWALVVMTLSQPFFSLVGTWFVTGWVPGWPQRRCGVRSMIHYGGTVTLNNVIVYLAYNAEKVLLGRALGADALGIYNQAYKLINIPTENLNTTVGMVAFPALSRVQHDPERLKSYFLKGYSLFLTLILPITMACALFAEDIILFICGPKWTSAAPVFRLLAPTILTFALVNPFAWLMLASGHAVRSLKIALLIAPVVILSYWLGLKHGPLGVATGFSTAMMLLVLPVILWAKAGTSISLKDIARACLPPVLSILAGAAAVLALHSLLVRIHPTFLRLLVNNCLLFGMYLAFLLFVMNQKGFYLRVLKETGIWEKLSGRRADSAS